MSISTIMLTIHYLIIWSALFKIMMMLQLQKNQNKFFHMKSSTNEKNN